MTAIESNGLEVERQALTVAVVDREIVLSGFSGSAPCLTAVSARETARRLIEAANALQRH